MNFFRSISNVLAIIAIFGVMVLGVASFMTSKDLASDINANADGITANGNGIIANADGITANTNATIANADGITTNTHRISMLDSSITTNADSAKAALASVRNLRKSAATNAALAQVRRNAQRTLSLVLTGKVDSTGSRVWNQMTADSTGSAAEATLANAVNSGNSIFQRIEALKRRVAQAEKVAGDAETVASSAQSKATTNAGVVSRIKKQALN